MSITIPDSVTRIGEGAFSGVANVAYSGNMTVEGSPWDAKCENGFVDGYFVYSDSSKSGLVRCSTEAQGIIIIPDSVTVIGNEAFSDCTGITGVIIPDNIWRIDSCAFQNCTSLTSIILPDYVEVISECALQNCTSLNCIHIPSNCQNINDSAFWGCDNLEYICSDSSDCAAHEYAENWNIGFKVCDGHASLKRAISELTSLLNTVKSDDAKEIINEALGNLTATFEIDADSILNNAKTAADNADKALADAKIAAKAELEEAVKNAISDEAKSGCSYYFTNIDNSTSIKDVNGYKNAGFDTIKSIDGTYTSTLSAKKAELNTALGNARSDEAKTILTDAITGIDNVKSISSLYSFASDTINRARDRDNEFNGKQAAYKSQFNRAINYNTAEYTKAYVKSLSDAIDAATSISALDKIYNDNRDKVDNCFERDDIIAEFDDIINEDDSSDEVKALVQAAIEAVIAAETTADAEKAAEEGRERIDYQLGVEEMTGICNGVINSERYSDEIKALAQEALEEMKNTETFSELQELYNKFESDVKLQETKDTAKAELLEAVPENASDGVMAIVNNALADIQASADTESYAGIVAEAKRNIENQVAAEILLAEAKDEALKDLSNELKKAVSDEAKEILNKAISTVENATSTAEVSVTKVRARSEASAADKALSNAIVDLKEQLEAAKEYVKSDEARAIIDKALEDVDLCTSLEAVDELAEQVDKAGLAAEEKLENSKSDAKSILEEAKQNAVSDEAKAALDEAIANVDKATNPDAVASAKTAGITKAENADKQAMLDKAQIKAADAQKIDYRSIVTVTATAENVPEGCELAIYVGDTKVADGDNKSVTYNAGELKADIEYTVKVIDANGNVQKTSDGKELTAEGGKITCNAGFFKILIAFFKGLFKKLPEVEVKP